MPARDMAAYMRARRARLKAEREAAEPVVDAAIPRGALVKVPDGEWAAIRAKAAAIGPGAVITKTGERFDVLRGEAFEARHVSPAATPARPPTSTSAYLSAYTPPPRSLIADGGRPHVSGFGSVATETAFFRANVTASLDQLAREAVEAKRERAAQEKRIAALEAAVERNANVNQFAQAVAGLFSYAIRR
jgi:hypothetical protein